MPSTDPFDQASQNIDAAKALLVQAMAKGGSDATRAYSDAVAAQQANKQATVQAALQQAAARGVPQQNQDVMSSTIGAPIDRSISYLNQASASRAADIAQRGANTQANLSELQGAIPAIRGQVQSRVDANNAKVAAQAQRDNLQLALAQMRLQQAQAKTTSPSQILSQMGGAPALNSQLDEITPGMAKAYQADFAGQRGGLAGPGNAPLGDDQMAANQRQLQLSYAEAMGRNNGLAPGQASGIYGPHLAQMANQATAAANKADPSAAAIGRATGLTVPQVQKMQTFPEYQKAQQLAELYVSQGKTMDDLRTALGKAKELQNKPATRAAILYLYRGQLPSPSYIPTGP